MVYIAKNSDQASELDLTSKSDSKFSAGFMAQLTPQSALVIGVVATVMAACSVGFLVLLYLVLNK